MNAFSNTIGNEKTTTTNGMVAYKSSMDANVDLFFKIGASRGKNIIPEFVKALAENKELALRIAQWARDVRGGAGERQIYRDILKYLEKNDLMAAAGLAIKTPEVGRWDDLLVFNGSPVEKLAQEMIAKAIFEDGNGLAAKWMPRKGPDAVKLRKAFGLSPKQYRKFLVGLTDVVEQKMCAKKWDEIDFSKLPSLASSRYKTAFYRNAETAYRRYADALVKGTAKINASAIYPHDAIKGWDSHSQNATTLAVMVAQWDALPNYLGEASVLPLVDVSGSMHSPELSPGLRPIDVALSLGLYTADKLRGAFQDCMLTFSTTPQLLKLKGNILQKLQQMNNSNWAMSTNLNAAFDKILSHAVSNKVPQADMPKTLMIFSDMQFNQCVNFTAHEMIQKKYAAAGYTVPNVVFWNLNARDNVPVRYDQTGTALVSGFSPSVMASVLGSEELTPKAVMLKTVMQERYALPEGAL